MKITANPLIRNSAINLGMLVFLFAWLLRFPLLVVVHFMRHPGLLLPFLWVCSLYGVAFVTAGGVVATAFGIIQELRKSFTLGRLRFTLFWIAVAIALGLLFERIHGILLVPVELDIFPTAHIIWVDFLMHFIRIGHIALLCYLLMWAGDAFINRYLSKRHRV
jgi:hypothetical protein